jgi:tRNA pseudouridine55 synthase
MKMSHAEVAEGMLLVDKPIGPTSHEVVEQARKAFGIRRIGHTGTLDPFASGLLLLCVGRSTRLAEYFHALPKRYVVEATLGASTDTDDHTGNVTGRSEGWRALSMDDVQRASVRRGSGGRRSQTVTVGGDRPLA